MQAMVCCKDTEAISFQREKIPTSISRQKATDLSGTAIANKDEFESRSGWRIRRFCHVEKSKG